MFIGDIVAAEIPDIGQESEFWLTNDELNRLTTDGIVYCAQIFLQ